MKKLRFIVLRGGNREKAEIRYVHAESIEQLRKEISRPHPIWEVEEGRPWWEGRITDRAIYPITPVEKS